MSTDYYKLAKDITRIHNSMIMLKDTGCPCCDRLPDNDMCLNCQIEQADADVLKAMNRLEELKKQKEKENESNC